MYRTFVILRHTFFESIVQPIFPLILILGTAVLILFGLLPFFTFSEDTVMYKAVGLDVVLLLVLIVTLFATSKSVFDEIEDRTMLTLMSKPVKKWEVLLGKYLGIIAAAAIAVIGLGIVLGICIWFRVPGDYTLDPRSIDQRVLLSLHGMRMMHILSLAPSLALLWLQISVLAAVGVALSTRLSLVVNLPLVIFLYIAGNLTRFLFPADANYSWPVKVLAQVLATLLPYLEIFDLRQKTVYSHIAIFQFARDPNAVPYSALMGYLAVAVLYAAAYSFFAMVAGLWMFQNRELGGAEG